MGCDAGRRGTGTVRRRLPGVLAALRPRVYSVLLCRWLGGRCAGRWRSRRRRSTVSSRLHRGNKSSIVTWWRRTAAHNRQSWLSCDFTDQLWSCSAVDRGSPVMCVCLAECPDNKCRSKWPLRWIFSVAGSFWLSQVSFTGQGHGSKFKNILYRLKMKLKLKNSNTLQAGLADVKWKL